MSSWQAETFVQLCKGEIERATPTSVSARASAWEGNSSSAWPVHSECQICSRMTYRCRGDVVGGQCSQNESHRRGIVRLKIVEGSAAVSRSKGGGRISKPDNLHVGACFDDGSRRESPFRWESKRTALNGILCLATPTTVACHSSSIWPMHLKLLFLITHRRSIESLAAAYSAPTSHRRPAQ